MKSKDIYKRIFKLIKPHSFGIICSLLLALVMVFCTLVIPIITGKAIDCMLGKGAVDTKALGRLLKLFLIVLLANGAASWLMTAINNKITFSITKDLRNQMFGKLHSLPISYIDSMGHGDLLSRMISDVDRLSDGLLLGFSQLFTGVLTIIGTLIFMLCTNVSITLIVVLLTPVSMFAASFISKKTYTHFKKQAAMQGNLTTFINENVNYVRLVQSYGAEPIKRAEFDKLTENYAQTNLKALFFSSTTNPVTRFVNSLVYAGVGVFGALLGINGRITIGTLSCFLSYANQYTKPFNEISGVITEFQNAVACSGRIFEFLSEKPGIDIVSNDIQTPFDATKDMPAGLALSGNIDINHLSFSYDKTKKLLEDLSFSVKPGTHIAIVGPTGCGKTTFINLLMRFYEPDSGEILFDGTRSDHIHKQDLRKNIGMVLQETWLKSGTIAENIAYGKPNATKEEIIEAAKKSHAHSFIMRLENGYDTVLKQDASNISQGQKQLLCIARVMLTLPPILILDEATSSIDTRTEAKITDAFQRLMEGRTSFIVAHRLSTIKNADLILVMKDGNIIEQGTHEELKKKNGFYNELLKASGR